MVFSVLQELSLRSICSVKMADVLPVWPSCLVNNIFTKHKNSGLMLIFVRRSRLFRLLRFDRSSSTNCRTPLEETVNTRGTGYFQLTQDEVRKKATRTFPAKSARHSFPAKETLAVRFPSNNCPPLVSRGERNARRSFPVKETPVICFLLKKRPSLVLFPPMKSPVARCLTNTLSNQRLASVSYSKFTASLAALLTYEYVTLSRVSV